MVSDAATSPLQVMLEAQVQSLRVILALSHQPLQVMLETNLETNLC
jgi:hypothetical protein